MSYRLKLTVMISLLIALSFSIGNTVLIATSFSRSLEDESQSALRAYDSIQTTLSLLGSAGALTDYNSLADTLSQMFERNAGSCQALSLTDGSRTIYQRRPEMVQGHMLPGLPAGRCAYRTVQDVYGHGLLIQSAIDAGKTQLTLRARFDLAPVYAARQAQQQFYRICYGIVVALGIISAWVFSYTMTRRLQKLANTVRKIASGDMTTRSRIQSQDEVGQLARDVDTMADQLQENIAKLETEMQRQEYFMGAFAHELKTPMTSIIGFADLLRQGDLDENTRMMAANYIYSEGHRLEKLAYKLLNLILLKKDSLVMKRVSLPSFMQDVDKTLSANLHSKGIRLVCRAERKRAVMEPDLIKSLLYNLIDNASKAMDDGGIIAVSASTVPGGCQFLVVDNGRGMEPQELSKITEAFYRVDKSRSRAQGGAGLGLSLCKQIAQLHDGSIVFSSKPGAGTKVTVTLHGKEGGGK